MKKNNTPHKIYNNIDEWYHPDIDYHEMMINFRWTRTLISDAMQENAKKEGISHEFLDPSFPLKSVHLFEHAGMDRAKDLTRQKFQFFNKQFNDELANIIKRWKPERVLEVGAGNGLLSRMLEMRGLNMIATDDFSWKLKQMYQVEKLGVKSALKTHQPDVVIGCWMPLYTDWTPFFRATPSVKYYIIIGEVDACCGGDWKMRKGWTMGQLASVERYSICRTDYLWIDDEFPGTSNFGMNHSAVYCYTRN